MAVIRCSRWEQAVAHVAGRAPRRLFDMTLWMLALVPALVQAPAAAQAQSAAPAGWTHQLANRVAAPRGAVVLMPGFGGGFADFSDAPAPGEHHSVLADSLAAQRIALVMVAPPAGVLFGGPAYLRALDSTVAAALSSITKEALPLAVGGFSAGGTDAVRLAQRCATGTCRLTHPVRALFAVDAPLDWLRLWQNAALVLRDRPAGGNVMEAQAIQRALAAGLGPQPTARSPRYLATSPLATTDRHGGNARLLAAMAVRMYTEPDVLWWLSERGADYYGMNAVDAASLIRHLRLQGNRRAELVVTTGRGYRSNGMRHPHSWSIVDQAELARWIAAQLDRP